MLVLHKRVLSLLFMVMGILFYPRPVFAAVSPEFPNLAEFSEEVSGSDASQITGLFSYGNFTLPVVQQPVGKPSYISENPAELTQFALASSFGATGLLAHNTLAGAHFSSLEPGDLLTVIYGDGHLEHFIIRQVEKYQALQPADPHSNFIDLADPDKTLSASSLFKRVYNHSDRLVLQTCIQANGNPSWGRLFIIAEPDDGKPSIIIRSIGYLNLN